MFEWFKKSSFNTSSSADQYIESVEKYIRANYKDPAAKQSSVTKPTKSVADTVTKTESDKSHVQNSRRDQTSSSSPSASDNSNEIMYSERDSGARFSLSDNYDSESIQYAIRGFSVFDSPFQTLNIIDEYTNMSFVSKMREYIKDKGLRDTDVYKAAQIDRRLFSKMITDIGYKPSKDTCIALCLAMKLTLSETEDLLSRAGFALSHSSKRDVILEYFFREKIYDVTTVNEVLFSLDQKILGRA